ncbi:sensor domain-containing diguanylate cyclase [Dyella acidiphila]|uniref:diguanylate cyclase n=1 Tax=Dyella acidiphila TaxID=2775866 RepID=A0ABR9GCM7_9GAMM|nr:GGDEF domain-containing protein [Dyella acidiphila]MBE1161780.1 GGDEF domain-containing protein [Dyella acidiphila]
MAALLLCMDAKSGTASVDNAQAEAWLTQADDAWSNNISRFRVILAQLQQHEDQLTSTQRWHFRLLNAQLLADKGDYAKAEPILHDIIDHSGDLPLSIRAMAALIRDKFLNRDYVSAYALANTLMAELPRVDNPQARLEGMEEVILMLDQTPVGQHDLALEYARQMKALLPSAKGQCYANALETQSMLYAGNLASTSPAFQAAIDRCLAAGESLQADALRLDQAYQMVDEGHADQAIAFLHSIAPEIEGTDYTPYLASLPVTQARAYLRLGDAVRARKFALDSIAITGPNSPLWTLQDAYEVLYQAEKKQGHDAAALAYYEKYAAQKTAAMDNAKAIALAYQTVRQQVLAAKMKAETLGKENKILQLSQALASQAQKSSRLFNALLLAVIAFFVLAMLWLWRSWRRFRWMARHDGLTRAYNREHFFAEARRALRQLHKAGGDACLIVLDLDHFKRVNDTHGHAAGDQVLRSAAMIVARELRPTDLLGRLGGEEFGILISGCLRDQGLEAANRIRNALATTPVMLDSQVAVMVSASLGMACTANSSFTLRQLLIDADAALYRAKESGRNQVSIDTSEMKSALPS